MLVKEVKFGTPFPAFAQTFIGIRLSISTASLTYGLSKVTHATPFHTYMRSGTYFCEKLSLKWWCHICLMLKKLKLGAKWYVTVPNSVTPIKPILWEWIYMSYEWYCQIVHRLYIYYISIRTDFRETVILNIILINFMTKNSGFFCRLVQQELNVACETSILWSMFMLNKYW